VYYYPDFFSWRVELRKKEADANLTNHSIIIILNNILPAHIGESQNGLKSQTKINYRLYIAVDVYINSMPDIHIRPHFPGTEDCNGRFRDGRLSGDDFLPV